jgi:hypothetical protein
MLGYFCNGFEVTPERLLEMSEKQLYNMFLDMVSGMEQEGRSGGYSHSILKAVKSWLVHNRIEVKRRIKIKGVQGTPTLRDERVPTKDELKRIFLAGDEKVKVASALVAESGLRIEVLSNYLGNDGLRVSDRPEVVVKDGVVEFAHMSTIVMVRRELSKSRHQYFSFLSEEGCGCLRTI